LFSNSTSDYTLISDILNDEFKDEIEFRNYINSPFGNGICFNIDGIKTDLIDWKQHFNSPEIIVENVRMASLTDIMGMKLDIITSPSEYARYDKKDFIDLAFLLDTFSIGEMINLYNARHKNFSYANRNIIEAFEYAELADKKPNPIMIQNLSWIETKEKIKNAVDGFIQSNN
jgi:hypothetical protein